MSINEICRDIRFYNLIMAVGARLEELRSVSGPTSPKRASDLIVLFRGVFAGKRGRRSIRVSGEVDQKRDGLPSSSARAVVGVSPMRRRAAVVLETFHQYRGRPSEIVRVGKAVLESWLRWCFSDGFACRDSPRRSGGLVCKASSMICRTGISWKGVGGKENEKEEREREKRQGTRDKNFNSHHTPQLSIHLSKPPSPSPCLPPSWHSNSRFSPAHT